MNQNFSKKLAVIDVDGTLYNGQMQHDLINFLFKRKLIGVFHYIVINLWFFLYKIKVIKKVDSVFKYAMGFVKGTDEQYIGVVLDEFISHTFSKKVFSNSSNLIATLKSEGYHTLILSTAVDALIVRVASFFEVDSHICTKLEIVSGLYTGNISGKVVYGKQKLVSLVDFCKNNNFELSHSVAYADHESDLPLLKAVYKGYIVNPDKKMNRIATRESLGIMIMK